MAKTCEIPSEISDAFKKFKLAKNQDNKAIVFKVNRESLQVVVEETLDNVPPADLVEYLPEAQPRYIAYSYRYEHDDGRVSYPLCFIFYCPPGIRSDLNMLYASTKTRLADSLQIQKIFEIRDAEEFTEEWLKEKLAFFR